MAQIANYVLLLGVVIGGTIFYHIGKSIGRREMKKEMKAVRP